MNQKANLQFIADTLLVEKVVRLDAGLRKDAGVVSDSLGYIAQLVKKHIIDKIDTSSPGALGKSVLKLMTPAIIFRISPLIGGALIFASQIFNFDLGSIWDSILSPFESKLKEGKPVSAGEVDAAAQSMISEGSDPFYDLRKMSEEGRLIKSAQLGGAWFLPTKGTGLLQRIFGFLGPRKGKNLAVAFIAWFIKTVLAGAGLLAASGTVADALGLKDEDDSSQQQQPQQQSFSAPPAQQQMPVPSLPSPRAHNLKPSGKGERHHPNDQNTIWQVPVYGNIRNTLVLWAKDIYPELEGNDNLIMNNPTFNKVANTLSRYMNPRYPNYLIVPPGFHSRKQIVDIFAGDVAQKMKKEV